MGIRITTDEPSFWSAEANDMAEVNVWTSPHFGKNLTGLAALFTAAIALIEAFRDPKDRG